MRISDKLYTCGVCSYVFENIQTSPGFACPECFGHFKRDEIGIMIIREPSEDWKKRNKDSWEFVKKNHPVGSYMEIFTR